MKVTLFTAAIITLLTSCQASSKLPTQHMIATANSYASRAGLDILRAGGSAVDAAIAAQMVLTLTEPQSSGIGGGAFLLHYTKDNGKIDAYDGRETTPTLLKPEHFYTKAGKLRKFSNVSVGGIAVGVPGLIKMLALAHSVHGKLSWDRLFEDAIRFAEEGFKVSPRLHNSIRKNTDLKQFQATRAYFYTADGKVIKINSLLKNPALAKTFREIAKNGPKSFYSGSIARNIVNIVRNSFPNPGYITIDDLKTYTARNRKIICKNYRDWIVCGMPPPTSGGIAVLQILGLLEGFNIPNLKPDSVEAIHLISEASRLAFADRQLYIGDPDFIDIPTKMLLNKDYLKRRRKQILRKVSMGIAKPGQPSGVSETKYGADTHEEFPSTSHISVIDSAGNAVSMTTSIERAFGSRLLVDGFLLNNQLTDFSFSQYKSEKRLANSIKAKKRPRSSMSPTLVFDKKKNLYATLGSPGGSRIIGYVTKTLIGILDWQLDMQTAINLPNNVNRNGFTELEQTTALTRIANDLKRIGHKIKIRKLTSGIHGIRVTPHGFDGGADLRREGISIGD